MFKTDSAPQPATSPDRAVPRKTVFLFLRVAIGIAVLAYLAKSGQINFPSLIRLFHAWPIALTAVLSLLLFPDLLRSVSVLRCLLYIDALLAGFILAAAALVMCFPPTRSRVSGLLGRWPGIKSIALRVLNAMAIHGKAQNRSFFVLLLSLLANLALVFVTALGVYPVDPWSFSTRLALVVSVRHLVNSLPLTPGGIGVRETAFNALFKLTGLSGGTEALLCVRLWNVLVGLLGVAVYLFGMQRSVYPYAEDPREAVVGYIAAGSTN